jgi:nucleotide-binding universal stress UspA family protein
MKKILFPTELSRKAPEVFRYATELAYFFKARLVVMHAFNQPEVKLHSQKELETMADESSNRLIEFVSTYLPVSYQNIKIDYVTKSGFASKSILETALEEDIDLIVMGMTNKTNALDSFMGTTTLDVLKKADCPVLMIPASARFEGIDNLVYTTNFEYRDLGAIQYLKKWSKIFEAPIHCLHVIEDQENEWRELKNMNILKAMYKRHKRVLFDMKPGDFQQEIEQFAKTKRADIIAMISHKRSFISRLIDKSDVNEVARRTHIPLLVIKDNAYEIDGDLAGWLELTNAIA